MPKLHIIHLSDLHVHGTDDVVLKRVDALSQCLEKEINGNDEVVLLVSGDIAFSGAKNQFDAAEFHFRKLEQSLQESLGKTPSWVMVPGNHDGSFKDSDQNRLFIIDGVIRLDDEKKIDDSVIATAVQPLSEYFDFEKRMRASAAPAVFKDSLLTIHERIIANKVVEFWEFNASWLSKVPEKQGDLIFPVSRYTEHLRREADFRVAVLHHPVNWYAQQTYHPLRQILSRSFALVLTGHEHIQNGFVQKILGSDQACLFLEGGTLGPHNNNEASEFSTLLFDIETGKIEKRIFRFSSDYDSFVEISDKRKTEQVSLISARDFNLTKSATEILEEMAAPFSHPVKDELHLSDVFVEPSFTILSTEDDVKPNIGVNDLLTELDKSRRVLVRADDHHGKTSLLHQIVIRLVQAGQVPLKISALELAKGKESRHERAVEEAVADFYGDAAVQTFQSIDRSRKILLIDNLDCLGHNPEKYVRVLEFAHRHFDKCIVTVNDRFDVAMLGSAEASKQFGEYSEYRMRGFSYGMRTELIQRWYGLDNSLDRSSLEVKIREAETQIDYAISKGLIPSTAFNVLMILQSLEATKKGSPIDAGVAHHYDMMLRRRLMDSGVVQKNLDGIYAYLSHLAWWMRVRETAAIDRSELQLFNEKFRTNIHNIDTNELIKFLVSARILNHSDSTYQFKYPSARFFFLAHYIGENQEEDHDVKQAAQDACRRLYRRENSNLVVFLASKTSSRWIIREVADVLKKLLVGMSPFNATSDSKILNGWVTETAKLAVSGTYDPKNRQKAREDDEEAQQMEDSQSHGESATDISELDLFSQINLVFKTSEILGIILKSKFGSLSASLKKELLHELFTGPLRAIAFFLRIVNEQPGALVEYLSNHWSERFPQLTSDRREKLAQRFVYMSLGAYSQALILRQGEITGSPDLAQYISGFIEEARDAEMNGGLPEGTSLTYRLLSVACRLSYPGDVPISEIEKLGNDLKKNPFAYTILQGLVSNHLYMFQVSFDLRQKLASAVDLDLKIQIINEMTKSDGKTLPSRRKIYKNPKSLLMQMTEKYLKINNNIMKRVGKENKDIN